MKRALFLILVVVLAIAFLPNLTWADSLPNLQVVNVSHCKTWEGTMYGSPAIRHQVTFWVRNNSSVPAVPTGRYGIWVRAYVNGMIDQRDISVWLRQVGPHQIVGPYVASAILRISNRPTAMHSIRVDADNPPSVIETTKADNIHWWSMDSWSLPWCPGAGPNAFGTVFEDKNRNGRQDPGERGLGGIIVQLWQGSRFVAATRSRGDGSWRINVSRGGTYSITAIVPRDVGLSGASFTTPRAYYGVPLTGGARGPYRFGLASMPPPPPRKRPIEPRPDATIIIPRATSHPVVYSQDPDRRGADVYVTIRSYPVTYIWYEFNQSAGRWIERRTAVTNYVDLNSIRLTASLSGNSQRWIRNELARRYPGARVHRAYWNLRAQPTYRIVRSRVLPNGTHEVQIRVTRIPFMDPGIYNVNVTARTRGTSWPGSRASDVQPPAVTSTGPQTVRAGTSLRVYLLETSIVK